MSIFEEKTVFRLSGFPQKVDQGERGTCVSFSMIALLEYYLGFKEKLSQQYLYACCHLDQTEEGTALETVFSAVKQFGVCRYADWPYNRHGSGDQAQLTDRALLQKIPTIKFDNVDFQPLKTNPPRGIDEYKSVLSGADGNRPSPIVVGCQMFASSARNPGWLTLPVSPSEQPSDLHAMLIYGWKDTPGMESKGYFFVQNSWGNNNDLKIPFEYIEQFAMSAGRFAVPAEAAPEAEESQEKTPAETVETMSEKNPGTNIVPSDVTAHKDNFFTSQKKNMQNGKYPYPGIKLPYPQKLGAYWNVKTSCFDQPENLRDPMGFSNFLKRNGVTHLYNEVRIFRIQIKTKYYYHLISAFLYRTDGKPVDANDLELLNRYYKEDYWEACRSKPGYTIFTVGTSGKFSEECTASCDPVRFLCEPGNDPGVWLFKLPQAECGNITQEFFTHILPGQYTEAIRKKLERWNSSNVINKKSIKESLGACSGRDLYDKHLNTALDELFCHGNYAKNKEGNIIPLSWGTLPKGYKKAKRYAKATERQIVSLILWLIVTLLLAATAYVKLPKEVGYLIILISAIVNYKRNQALQRFRFGDSN
ncbi:MAG: C1 family peptidase [Lentisphaeria bacterium]|nr:C1 family peptidase [Lentisphaeria bacterium]